jgi:DNA repair exonuclease SbcCD ATPase subunit
MKIREWTWKNYKSYGSVPQTIRFDKDRGELILLIGENGAGKSSLIETLDIGFFGEVQNKQGKRLTQKNLPNRVNGHLEVNVVFETDELMNVTRTMDNASAAMKTSLIVDKVPYGKANKIDDKIQEKIGFDYKTYKSFISMNVNNFKNFISLTPEEKRILLDKLFNLEVINDLNKVLKQLVKQNDLSFNSVNSEIRIYRENIKELENTIKTVLEKNNDDKEQQLLDLKAALASKKPAFTALEEQKAELEETITTFQDGLSGLNLKVRDIDRDILEIKGKISLYEAGKCPTCHTELVGELNLLPVFTERLNKTNEVRIKLKNKITKAQDALRETTAELSQVSSSYNAMLQTLSEMKFKMTALKNTDAVVDVTAFRGNVDSLTDKLTGKEDEYLELQKMKFVYDILNPIWGELGIKRDIIDSIVGPLNEFIAEDLIHLKTRFVVELDNNFDAHIYEWSNEIDPDSLSTGEAKKINLIIMLAYIKMLRMKRDINVLFLDEVFASIDIKGIDDILILFKKFANERNINVIMVHHSELKEWFFDRIINIKKAAFSYLEEKYING